MSPGVNPGSAPTPRSGRIPYLHQSALQAQPSPAILHSGLLAGCKRGDGSLQKRCDPPRFRPPWCSVRLDSTRLASARITICSGVPPLLFSHARVVECIAAGNLLLRQYFCVKLSALIHQISPLDGLELTTAISLITFLFPPFSKLSSGCSWSRTAHCEFACHFRFDIHPWHSCALPLQPRASLV